MAAWVLINTVKKKLLKTEREKGSRASITFSQHYISYVYVLEEQRLIFRYLARMHNKSKKQKQSNGGGVTLHVFYLHNSHFHTQGGHLIHKSHSWREAKLANPAVIRFVQDSTLPCASLLSCQCSYIWFMKSMTASSDSR